MAVGAIELGVAAAPPIRGEKCVQYASQQSWLSRVQADSGSPRQISSLTS